MKHGVVINLNEDDIEQFISGIDGDNVEVCGLGGNVVRQLCKSISSGHNYNIFPDNYFSNFRMAEELMKQDFHYVDTIRGNRLHGAPLLSETDLKNQGQGSKSSVYEKNLNIVLVRWFDNKSVTFISSYVGLEPTSQVQCYTKHIIPPHQQASHYQRIQCQYLGGVDLLDIMCSLYKRLLKSKRWYLYIFFHTLTITVVNSWFVLY